MFYSSSPYFHEESLCRTCFGMPKDGGVFLAVYYKLHLQNNEV